MFRGNFRIFLIGFAKTLVPVFKSAFYGQSLCLNINNNNVGKVCNLGGKCPKKNCNDEKM
jgi:hypothetical protein